MTETSPQPNLPNPGRHADPSKGWWQRFLDVWRVLLAMQPARVVAIASAVLVAVGTLGVAVPEGLSGKVAAAITAIYAVVAIVQGEVVRARVVPEATLPAGTPKVDPFDGTQTGAVGTAPDPQV